MKTRDTRGIAYGVFFFSFHSTLSAIVVDAFLYSELASWTMTGWQSCILIIKQACSKSFC